MVGLGLASRPSTLPEWIVSWGWHTRGAVVAGADTIGGALRFGAVPSVVGGTNGGGDTSCRRLHLAARPQGGRAEGPGTSSERQSSRSLVPATPFLPPVSAWNISDLAPISQGSTLQSPHFEVEP